MYLLVALISGGAWFAAYVLSRALTAPHPVIPLSTAGFGPETPAVAALLASGWKRGPAAADATLVDLIVRGHVELSADATVHVAADGDGYRPYERMVLDRARTRSRLADLAFRDPGSAEEWHRRFREAVLKETRAAKLSRPRISGPVLTLLILLGLVTGVFAGLAAWQIPMAFPEQAMLVPGVGLCLWMALIWISQDDGERYRPAGTEAAARWLGIPASLTRQGHSERPVSPAAVAGQGRQFAYAVALGAGSVDGLSLDVGNRDLVWSTRSQRPIPITYPRTRPRHGLPLPGLLLGGLGYTAFGALLLRLFGEYFWAALPATLILIFGLYILGRTITDIASPRTITGEVLWRCTWRARTVEDEPDRPWLDYLAVDDGSGDPTVAWALRSEQAPGVREGSTVTIRARQWTRQVIEIRS